MDSSRCSLPIKQWPECHQALWDRAISLFGSGGAGAAHWLPRSIRNVEANWGHWLGFLARSDQLKPSAFPAQTIEIDPLVDYLREMEAHCRGTTMYSNVRDMNEFIRVAEPMADRTLLKQLLSELTSMMIPREDDIACRVGPSDLYHAGLRRMDRYRAMSFDQWYDAMAYGDGLFMSLLAVKPLRLGTYIQMRWDTSLVRSKDGSYRLKILPGENKTAINGGTPLPAALAPYITHWHEISEEVLSRQIREKHVWVTHFGTAMCDGQLRARLRAACLDEIEEDVWPHRARKIAASSLALLQPENAVLGSIALDHSAPRTTLRNYVATPGLINNAAHLRLRAARK